MGTVKRYGWGHSGMLSVPSNSGNYVEYADYAALEAALTAAEQRAKRLICPHGDPACPCRDGDACHYEGKNPMTPPIKQWEQRAKELEEALRDTTRALEIVLAKQAANTLDLNKLAVRPSIEEIIKRAAFGKEDAALAQPRTGSQTK